MSFFFFFLCVTRQITVKAKRPISPGYTTNDIINDIIGHDHGTAVVARTACGNCGNDASDDDDGGSGGGKDSSMKLQDGFPPYVVNGWKW